MHVCEISIIIILICQKLGSVRPVQQKIKLPSPKWLQASAFFRQALSTRDELYWEQIHVLLMSCPGLLHVQHNIIYQSKLLDSCIKTRITEKYQRNFLGKYKIFIKSLWNINTRK